MADEITFADAPVGLFLFNGELCVKTEYYTHGRPDAYIVGSGEYFWGGCSRNEEVGKLMVTPIDTAELTRLRAENERLKADANAWRAIYARWSKNPVYQYIEAAAQRDQCASRTAHMNEWIEGLVAHWEDHEPCTCRRKFDGARIAELEAALSAIRDAKGDEVVLYEQARRRATETLEGRDDGR